MSMRPSVPEVEGIDLDFTPRDYFTLRDLHLALPSDIKGQARREMARTLAQRGESVPAELEGADLSGADRLAWGLIHPAMMGGEYLPALRPDEVEIARISLASATADQISVRARRDLGRIAYAIVDEYGDEEGARENYRLVPATSIDPLPMRRLVAMLDGACERGGAVLSHVVWFIEDCSSDADALRGFVAVESDFYPELGRYYAARLDAYFAGLAAERGDADDD